MDQTVSTSQNTTHLYEICSILSIPFSNRSDSENDKLVTMLCNLGYFQHYVADISERKDFAFALSKNMTYKHYPKGAAVCHPSDPESDFGIILQGHAILYDHKSREKFDAENIEKSYKFLPFRKHMEDKEFSKKLRKWIALKDIIANTGSITSLRNYPIKPTRFSSMYNSIAGALVSTVNELLGDARYQEDILEDDGNLTLEEKLLLLHHDGSIQNYFTDGIASYEKAKDLKDGDTITEMSLLTGMSVQHPIIACQDLHILSVSHADFYALFQERKGNLAEKKKFLRTLFPELLLTMIVKLAAAVVEKSLVSRDMVYEQGEEADAIYIVKTGGVQLATYEEGEKVEKIPCSAYLTDGPKKNNTGKHKLIIGDIGMSGIFGEEEVINNKPRKYTAMCNRSPTLLYMIKKEVYRDIFEKHFPVIAQAYKLGMKSKIDWRQDRLKKGIKVMNDIVEGPPKKVTTKIIIKTPRLQDMSEVSSKNLGMKRSELVYDTQTATVMNFEERNSRNTRSGVKITVCGMDQQSNNAPLRKLFEPVKPSKSPEGNPHRKTVKRSLTILEKKTHVKNNKSIQQKSLQKSNSKANNDDLSTDIPMLYRLSTPTKFAQPLNWRASPSSSPTSARGHYHQQPQTPIAQPRILNLAKGSVLMNQLFSHSPVQDPEKGANIEPINIPNSARIMYTGSPLLNSIVQGAGRDNSPVSPEQSPLGGFDGKTFTEAFKNATLSRKSSHFYHRIISARPIFKKEGPDAHMGHDSTPIAVSRAQLHSSQDSIVPKLNLVTHRSSLANLNGGSNHTIYNSARNSPGSPKMLSMTARGSEYFDSPKVNPKKVFVLNRGDSDPRIVLVDHDATKLKSRKQSRGGL